MLFEQNGKFFLSVFCCQWKKYFRKTDVRIGFFIIFAVDTIIYLKIQ